MISTRQNIKQLFDTTSVFINCNSSSKINRMSKLKIFTLIGLLLITSVSVAQKYRYIKGETYEGIVNIRAYVYGSKLIQSYIPTDIEIARLEKKIPAQLADLVKKYRFHEYANDSCDIEKNLSKYKRIYLGMCFNGENEIVVNFYIGLPNQDLIMPKSFNPGLCMNFTLVYNIKKDSLDGLFTPDE